MKRPADTSFTVAELRKQLGVCFTLALRRDDAVPPTEARLGYLREAAGAVVERLQQAVDDGDVSRPEVLLVLLGAALVAASEGE